MIKETKYEGYYVSDSGEVFSSWKGSPYGRVKVDMYLMKLFKDNVGRMGVRLANKSLRVHRLVYDTFLGIPIGYEVDHIDRNASNNNLTNLRLASHQENQQNKNIRSNNKTGYKGVYFNKNNKSGRPYQAYIKLPCGKHKYLGCYTTAKEAGKAYDCAALLSFKQFAATNKDLLP
jgi:hypothetical protein